MEGPRFQFRTRDPSESKFSEHASTTLDPLGQGQSSPSRAEGSSGLRAQASRPPRVGALG
eukprot:CAMPEP_0184330202 /NCGR_PEP_ID=MMETSP1049-20130417/144557_1 /TAXON_ID=77928 /ORGANISM="Proteomonas sulcata, Strain CCMP704" /LENGTH=59 /DNA_ID=CAMNT_0026652619 /DNA_START=618 /DNA_END=800 /DNA_ORIENTATION=+